MNVTIVVFFVVITLFLTLLWMFIKESFSEIKKQQKIEKERQEKFHYKSTHKERKYGIAIFVSFFTSPFVYFLWRDFGGEKIINKPLAVIIIYVALVLCVVWLHEKYSNK